MLLRDNFTCKVCGNNNRDSIQVHHLNGYNWCKEKRTDETNGITLCNNCHKNFHLKYGNGNNTKEQFEEWCGYALNLLKYEKELYYSRKIYCIEEDKVYESAHVLAKELGCKDTQVYSVCNHSIKSNKTYNKSVRGKHLLWLDEYEKCTDEDIQRYLKWCKPKSRSRNRKVICVTTNKIFNSIKEAGEYYKIKTSGIIRCCNKKFKYSGKLNGKKLSWEYL